jgi:hypothetical protein
VSSPQFSARPQSFPEPFFLKGTQTFDQAQGGNLVLIDVATKEIVPPNPLPRPDLEANPAAAPASSGRDLDGA